MCQKDKSSPKGPKGYSNKESRLLAGACYPLGALSGGLLPLAICIQAYREHDARLGFHAKQSMICGMLLAMAGYVLWMTGLGAVLLYLGSGIGSLATAHRIMWGGAYLPPAGVLLMLWPMTAVLLGKRPSLPLLTKRLEKHHREAGTPHTVLSRTMEFAFYILGALTLGIGPVVLQKYAAKKAGVPISAHMVRACNRNLLVLAVIVAVPSLVLAGGVGGVILGVISQERFARLVPWLGIFVIVTIVTNCAWNLRTAWKADGGLQE